MLLNSFVIICCVVRVILCILKNYFDFQKVQNPILRLSAVPAASCRQVISGMSWGKIMVRVRNTLYSASGNLLAKQPERSMRVCVCVCSWISLWLSREIWWGEKSVVVLFCFVFLSSQLE